MKQTTLLYSLLIDEINESSNVSSLIMKISIFICTKKDLLLKIDSMTI